MALQPSGRKIGVFGGTFNPPHLGHLVGAMCALEQLGLDELIFMPANIPPHKQGQTLASASDRLAMTRLAVTGEPRFAVSDLEITRVGTSYTVDTIRELHERLDPAALYLIIGLDNLAIFGSWKDSEVLLSMCKLAVLSRQGTTLGELPKAILDVTTFVSMPTIEISSTWLRSRVHRGESLRYLVPEQVVDFIQSHQLYLD